jgi:hypothetical protein
VIVGWGSWRGSGATTGALAMAVSLAARCDEPVWLVEADPCGGVLAARLGLHEGVGGLERLAFPTGGSVRPPEAATWFAGAAAVAGSLHLVPAPGDAFRAWTCHSPRADWPGALRELPGHTVIDLGRLHPGAPVGAVLARLDMLLVVVSDDVVSVAAAVEWAEARGHVAPHAAGLTHDIARLVLATVPGSPEPIGRTATDVELGDRLAGRLPWAPDTAAALHRGVDLGSRRWVRDPLLQAIGNLVDRCLHWTAVSEGAPA